MKNYTTPRTLSDCQWQTGYASAQLRQEGRIADKVIAVIAALAIPAVTYWISTGA